VTMPMYEYECEKCGQAFEVEQKISELPLTTCLLVVKHPQVNIEVACGGPVKRLIPGATSFVLKGSGWLKDGY